MPRPAREMQCGVPLAFLIFGILSECVAGPGIWISGGAWAPSSSMVRHL
jgi:hypothetical protein